MKKIRRNTHEKRFIEVTSIAVARPPVKIDEPPRIRLLSYYC